MGRQATKSAKTRRAVLDAAIQCYVTLGYANTTTTEIAKTAGISRGAMIHHFPTKRELLHASVHHLVDRRIEEFVAAIREVRKDEDPVNFEGVEAYWDHLKSDLFTAFNELRVAARTDDELGNIMRTANDRFETEWYKAVRGLFPEWEDKGPLLELAMDLTQFLCEGMAINTLSHDAGDRRRRIRGYLKARLSEILTAAENPDRDKAIAQFLEETRDAT